MVECFKCKNENPSTANYCMMCGNAISDSARKRFTNFQKVERTKAYRELNVKIEKLERENSELKLQNNEENNILNNVKNENELLYKQLTESRKLDKPKKYQNSLERKNLYLYMALFFILLITLFILINFKNVA